MEGLISHLSFSKGCPHLKQRVAPLWYWVVLTAIFFLLSVANNKAYAYNISMPVHMVFRASSLAASLIVGYFVFKKRYVLMFSSYCGFPLCSTRFDYSAMLRAKFWVLCWSHSEL
jgi:hypothetical protein